MGACMRLNRAQALKRVGALLAVGLSLYVGGVQAQSGAAVLRQIQEAARQLNYVGVYAYQQGDYIYRKDDLSDSSYLVLTGERCGSW